MTRKLEEVSMRNENNKMTLINVERLLTRLQNVHIVLKSQLVNRRSQSCRISHNQTITVIFPTGL